MTTIISIGLSDFENTTSFFLGTFFGHAGKGGRL
jgi:hypothetical protein